VRARLQSHDDLLQRGVAGALSDAVDSHLGLSRARGNTRQGAGGGKTEVVVAVRRENGYERGSTGLVGLLSCVRGKHST
jgi:hypothetical protein